LFLACVSPIAFRDLLANSFQFGRRMLSKPTSTRSGVGLYSLVPLQMSADLKNKDYGSGFTTWVDQRQR
jgi:hypothetical protein